MITESRAVHLCWCVDDSFDFLWDQRTASVLWNIPVAWIIPPFDSANITIIVLLYQVSLICPRLAAAPSTTRTFSHSAIQPVGHSIIQVVTQTFRSVSYFHNAFYSTIQSMRPGRWVIHLSHHSSFRPSLHNALFPWTFLHATLINRSLGHACQLSIHLLIHP